MKHLITVLVSGILGWTLLAQPTVSVVSTEKSGDVTVVNLSFAGIESPTKLVVAYGLGAGKADGVGGWDAVEELATLTAGTTSYRYELPAAWGKTAFMARFFLAANAPYDNALDYVETTDSKPIHLGFAPGPNTISRLKFHYLSCGGGIFYGYMPNIGYYDDATDYRFFYVGGTLYLDFPVNSTRVSTQSFTFDAVNELELGNFYIKDLASGTVIAQGSPQEFATPESVVRDKNEMTFFGLPNDVQDKGRIYSLDVYDRASAEDELALVHSFRPVLKDNVAGLYDSKTGAFILPDEGGAALTYGKVLPYDGPMSAASDLVSAIENPDAPVIATVTHLETAPGSLTFRFGIASFGRDSESCDLYAEVTGGAGAGTRKIATATEPWLTATVEGLVPGETYAVKFFAQNATWTEPAYYNAGETMSFTMPGIRVTDGVDDYVLLDYVRADGSQDVDTGLKVTRDTVVEFTLSINEINAGQWALCGSGWSTSGFFLSYVFGYMDNLWQGYFQFCSGNAPTPSIGTTTGPWKLGEWTSVRLAYDAIDVNDAHYALEPTDDNNPYDNLHILATPNWCQTRGVGKFRHLKIFEGSTVVRNYYAAKNLRTQEAGFFDIKNKTFTTSIEGASPLIASEGLLDRKDYEKKPGLMVIIK